MEAFIGIDPGRCTGVAIAIVAKKMDCPPVIFFDSAFSLPAFSGAGRYHATIQYLRRVLGDLVKRCDKVYFCYELQVGLATPFSMVYAADENAMKPIFKVVADQLEKPYDFLEITSSSLGGLFGFRGAAKQKTKKGVPPKKTIREIVRDCVVDEFALDRSHLGKALDAWDAAVIMRAGIYKIYGRSDRVVDVVYCNLCRKGFVVGAESQVCGCGSISGRKVDDTRFKFTMHESAMKKASQLVSIDLPTMMGVTPVGEARIVPWDAPNIMLDFVKIPKEVKAD